MYRDNVDLWLEIRRLQDENDRLREETKNLREDIDSLETLCMHLSDMIGHHNA